MSKKINVNPGQYKVGGRAHQGEDIVHDVQRQAYAQQQAQAELWQPKRQEAPARPVSPPREEVRQTQPGRRPARRASRPAAPKAKAKAKRRTRAPRAPKTAARKRKAPKRKERAQ